MTDVKLHLDRPPYAEVENRVRHLLRDLYGFVPLNLGVELADHVHVAVTEYQDSLLKDIASMEET